MEMSVAMRKKEKKFMKKRIAAVVLALLLVVTGMPFMEADGTGGTDSSSARGLIACADAASKKPAFTGTSCTEHSGAAAIIDYIMRLYPHSSRYPKGGLCWGYAEEVSTLLAESRSTSYYSGLKFTKSNFKKKCIGVRAGTHIRLSNSKTFSAGSGHSLVLFKVTEDEVIWADNNGTGTNTVIYYKGTIDSFYAKYDHQFKYITMISVPKKYKDSHAPVLEAESDDENGRIRLKWTKTAGADKYVVYRSDAKEGTYKIVGETESTSFADSTAEPGKRFYYKIKAVKSSGSTISNIESGRLRLPAPKVQIKNDPVTGQIVLSWKPVPDATSYTVYRRPAGSSEYTKVKNITSCTFTDAGAAQENGAVKIEYGVKAIYSKNPDANSVYGEARGEVKTPASSDIQVSQNA